MSNYHHYTTRARSNHTWEPEEQGERTETSYTSNWRRRGGGGNQQTNSYRGDRNDRTSGYSEFQPLRNRREALPDQSTSWRSSSTTTQGQGGWGTRRNNFDNRGGGEESSIWSTGEYKPISSSCRRGSKSPSPPPYSQSGWTTPERRQKLHQRSTPLPIPSPAYLEAASSSTSPSTNDEPPILVLDLNHTLLCRSERNRAGSKIPLVRPYLSTFLEYISSPSSTSSSTDSQRVQRFLPIIFSSARYRNVLSLLSALNLVPSEKLPPPYDPRQPPLPPSPEVKGPYSEVYVCNREEEGDVLRLVWTRENMGLSDRDFRGDVETCKNLEGVWKALKLGQSPSSSQSIEGVEQVEEVGEVETEKKRNLEGAKRTILLDDEISKAAQQPYSLLPIKPFILTRKDFPILPSFQQKYPNEPPPPPFALELPHSDHPAWQDKSLLKVVFELDWIREEWSSKGKNIAYEIKNGGFEKMREEVEKELEEERGGEVIGQKEIEEEMEKRGEEICRKAGIQVRREWDKGWRERVLEKFR